VRHAPPARLSAGDPNVPRYDFDCAACGTRFEVVHGVFADPPTTCPVCGGGPIKKAFAPPTIHFKGSGWAKKERRATVAPGSAKTGGGEGASTATEAGAGKGSAGDKADAGPTSSEPAATTTPAATPAGPAPGSAAD
jgi:putative FmdB family regulatory protein